MPAVGHSKIAHDANDHIPRLVDGSRVTAAAARALSSDRRRRDVATLPRRRRIPKASANRVATAEDVVNERPIDDNWMNFRREICCDETPSGHYARAHHTEVLRRDRGEAHTQRMRAVRCDAFHLDIRSEERRV